MLVDSHCHLDFPDFAPDLDGTVARARAAGVGLMLTIGTKLSQFDGVCAVAERYPDVWCSVGIHPHEAATESGDTARLVDLAKHPKVVGFGETGLDFFYERSPRDAQERSFRAHIAAARETGLPLIVHTRDADTETGAILTEEMPRGRFTGLLHCFSSSRELAEKAVELGFYISLSGIVTFKKADDLRATVAAVPLNRILVETDAPYLAPIPMRGKRNEPAFVVHTAAKVAEIKDVTPEALAEATTANFLRLFTKVEFDEFNNPMRVTILGCGAAGGVPSIHVGWGQCDPANPRNRRRRQSILVEQGNTAILVDTSPDLRAQLLDARVRRLDAVLYTHAHADHLHGIDDLREVNRAMNGPIDCYAKADILSAVRARFSYVFEDAGHGALRVVFRPWLVPHEIDGPFAVGDVTIEPYPQDHGFGQVTTGFRFGSVAYSTDVHELPQESLARLHGLDLWVVSCLSEKVHETHAHLDKVLGWVDRIRPKRTVLVHMSSRLDYATLVATLPANVVPAYDGMVLEV